MDLQGNTGVMQPLETRQLSASNGVDTHRRLGCWRECKCCVACVAAVGIVVGVAAIAMYSSFKSPSETLDPFSFKPVHLNVDLANLKLTLTFDINLEVTNPNWFGATAENATVSVWYLNNYHNPLLPQTWKYLGNTVLAESVDLEPHAKVEVPLQIDLVGNPETTVLTALLQDCVRLNPEIPLQLGLSQMVAKIWKITVSIPDQFLNVTLNSCGELGKFAIPANIV